MHSHQQWIRVPVASYPHQHLVLSIFWCVVVSLIVLICISLMTYDVVHLFICLSAICISSLVRCLFRSFAHFKKYLFFIYYFILLFILAAPCLSCGTRDLLLVAARRLLSCDMRDLFLVAACGLLSSGMSVGSSSLTRDRTWAPALGAESYPLDHQGNPLPIF